MKLETVSVVIKDGKLLNVRNSNVISLRVVETEEENIKKEENIE